MEIEKYKWYKSVQITPELSSLEKDSNGVKGWFVIEISNGDLYTANRWKEGSYWYWDVESAYTEKLIETEGVKNWMLIQAPEK
ncbi:MAG: hypothetical protein K2H60_03010 [Muribaculaceae bacterium]|nr:hypothetical protein [Muribaculaceae bacterium]